MNVGKLSMFFSTNNFYEPNSATVPPFIGMEIIRMNWWGTESDGGPESRTGENNWKRRCFGNIAPCSEYVLQKCDAIC